MSRTKKFVAAIVLMAGSFGCGLTFTWTDVHRALWWANVVGIYGITLGVFLFFGSLGLAINAVTSEPEAQG